MAIGINGQLCSALISVREGFVITKQFSVLAHIRVQVRGHSCIMPILPKANLTLSRTDLPFSLHLDFVLNCAKIL